MAPWRAEAAPPRRALRRRALGAKRPGSAADDDAAPDAAPPAAEPLMLSPLERKEFEYSDLDDWMGEADQVIRRSQLLLDQLAPAARPPPPSAA